uniref:hypothetical protein n=1 Tax=Thaumasiovibrio occultus TaxID=1891184 RepID=UPI000B3647B2|nr:hypothetical protein [Thaumasiovibrio occultus]
MLYEGGHLIKVYYELSEGEDFLKDLGEMNSNYAAAMLGLLTKGSMRIGAVILVALSLLMGRGENGVLWRRVVGFSILAMIALQLIFHSAMEYDDFIFDGVALGLMRSVVELLTNIDYYLMEMYRPHSIYSAILYAETWFAFYMLFSSPGSVQSAEQSRSADLVSCGTSHEPLVSRRR